MYKILQDITQRARSAFAAAAVSALAGMALLGAAEDAEAGYTCVDNITQVGNSVTMVISATSGGPFTNCISNKGIGTSSANISISSSILSTQVGAVVPGDNVSIEALVRRQGLGSDFLIFCQHASAGGACSTSNSGFINGVDYVECWVRGEQIVLPDPAIPGVPVVITTTCIVNY